MRFSIIFLITLFSSTTLFSQSIEQSFSNFINDKELENAQICFDIIDLSSSREIFEYQSNKSITTASTLKLITTASALEILGEQHVFETKLLLDGVVKNGILEGNIIIRGEGDPTLGSMKFMKHYGEFMFEWSQAISALGITKINGKIIGDCSYFEGSSLTGSTAVQDIGNYYGSGAHSLSAYENTYQLYFSSPNKADAEVTITNTIPPVLDIINIVNEVKSSTINKDRAFIYGIPESNLQVVKGTIPMNKKMYKIKGSIPDPALLLAHQLTEHLATQNIEVKEKAISYIDANKSEDYLPENIQTIHTLKSPPLKDIVTYINMRSINSFANNLIKNIGKKAKNKATYEAGIKAIQEHWANKGVDITGWYQEDGSGLSRANAVTAKQLTSVIALLNPELIPTLKLGLKDFAKSKGKIITKSGYMNRVRSFAGYITLSDGREAAFTIIANNYNCSASQMRKKMEVFLLSL